MVVPSPDFDRLRKTLYCGQADRVPLAEVTIDEGAKDAFLGKPVNDLSTDIEFYLNAGYDYITLGRRIAGFPPIWNAACLDNYYEAQRAVGRGSAEGVISDWDDYQAYPWMNPGSLDFRILDEAERILPREMKVIRYLGPAFQMAWMLMGFEAFSYRLADDPDLVEAVMDRIFQLIFRELEDALHRDVVAAVWYLDDIAIKDRLMVSPRFLRAYFFPKLKLIGDACKRRGIPLIYHTDGDIREVLDDIIDAGVNAIHPIDPTALNIYEFKPKVAGKLCVIGNIDVDLLTRGTQEQVEADTEQHLRSLAPGGGYVLGSSNSITRSTKPDNYRAMLEATLKHGR